MHERYFFFVIEIPNIIIRACVYECVSVAVNVCVCVDVLWYAALLRICLRIFVQMFDDFEQTKKTVLAVSL